MAKALEMIINNKTKPCNCGCSGADPWRRRVYYRKVKKVTETEEFGDWDNSRRRIDLLAIDPQANFAVIELKRTNDGGHMELQAIRYASMISAMTFERAAQIHAEFLVRMGETA